MDHLRGLVMVLMVFDHPREYFHGASIDSTNLAQTNPALFLTRWITHFCAPTFALLAGLGARLALDCGRDQRMMFRHLVTFEETNVKLGLFSRPNPSLLLGLVSWSQCGLFVILGVLLTLRMPAWFVGLFGLAIIVGHNALDCYGPASAASHGPCSWFAELKGRHRDWFLLEYL